MENGFEFEDDYSEYVVNAGCSDYLDVTYNGESFYITVYNFSEYATYAENCYMVSIDSDSNYGPELNVTLPGGFKVGMTEDELITAFGEYEYNLYEYDDYNSYSVYEPNNYDYSHYMDFRVENGVVEKVRKYCTKFPE